MDIHCFGTGFKIASRFATVSKDEILGVNKAVAPKNVKKQTNLAFRFLLVARKKNPTEFATKC